MKKYLICAFFVIGFVIAFNFPYYTTAVSATCFDTLSSCIDSCFSLSTTQLSCNKRCSDAYDRCSGNKKTQKKPKVRMICYNFYYFMTFSCGGGHPIQTDGHLSIRAKNYREAYKQLEYQATSNHCH